MTQWKEIIIGEKEVIEIEQSPRSGYARVVDSHSPFDGEYVFASRPHVALAMLKNKLEAMKDEAVN